jgi:hypothetical protein
VLLRVGRTPRLSTNRANKHRPRSLPIIRHLSTSLRHHFCRRRLLFRPKATVSRYKVTSRRWLRLARRRQLSRTHHRYMVMTDHRRRLQHTITQLRRFLGTHIEPPSGPRGSVRSRLHYKTTLRVRPALKSKFILIQKYKGKFKTSPKIRHKTEAKKQPKIRIKNKPKVQRKIIPRLHSRISGPHQQFLRTGLATARIRSRYQAQLIRTRNHAAYFNLRLKRRRAIVFYTRAHKNCKSPKRDKTEFPKYPPLTPSKFLRSLRARERKRRAYLKYLYYTLAPKTKYKPSRLTFLDSGEIRIDPGTFPLKLVSTKERPTLHSVRRRRLRIRLQYYRRLRGRLRFRAPTRTTLRLRKRLNAAIRLRRRQLFMPSRATRRSYNFSRKEIPTHIQGNTHASRIIRAIRAEALQSYPRTLRPLRRGRAATFIRATKRLY